MTAATITRAEFLKSAERSEVAANATLQARWGSTAGDTSQSSPLVAQADAAAEVARQLTLLSSALAEDGLTMEGIYWDLEGETVAVDYTMPDGGTYLGGAASVSVLVTRSRPNLAEGTTTINGLIQL